jgi:hypothetical protein
VFGGTSRKHSSHPRHQREALSQQTIDGRRSGDDGVASLEGTLLDLGFSVDMWHCYYLFCNWELRWDL